MTKRINNFNMMKMMKRSDDAQVVKKEAPKIASLQRCNSGVLGMPPGMLAEDGAGASEEAERI